MKPISGGADLHLHTTYSDGYCSPHELLERVAKIGLTAIAVTDHDEISAIPEATDLGRVKGIEVIPGVELSVNYQGQDTHLLAYCFDCENAEFLKHLSLFKNQRISRAKEIVDKLEMLGMPISFACVLKKAGEGTVGRPHIANVLLEDGFVYSFQEAFDKYLGNGKPAHVDKYKIDLTSAIKMVRAAGGVCVVAHPAIQLNHEELLQLIECGVDGIEVVHPRHTPEETECYKNLTRQHNLLATGGSDFHGIPRGGEVLGKFKVPYHVVEDIKARAGFWKTKTL